MHAARYGAEDHTSNGLQIVKLIDHENKAEVSILVSVGNNAFDMKVKEVPVSTKYFPEASSTTLKQSVVYGCKTLAVMLRYRLHTTARLKAAIFIP